jgi:Flp pilus assembly CpaF family ATPase
MMGLYRCICSNGLVVCDAEFSAFSICHINYNFEELRKVVEKVVATVPGIIDKRNVMTKTELTEEQKREMAIETYRIRKNLVSEAKLVLDDATINDLLFPTRKEDEGNSLWQVFNVLQEKMIKGGFSATGKNGKVRKQRPISSVKKDADYNQQLWALAEKYMPATVAA